MEVEYTICQIQSGQISLAAKTHRQLGGNPQLQVQFTPTQVTWEIVNLVDGTPETLRGAPRQDHIDFYFILRNFRRIRNQFPASTVAPDFALRLPAVSSVGTERPGGKRVRMVFPAYRYAMESVELFVTQAPSFSALGLEPFMHLDIESTPSTLYSQEMLEVHFGIQADFEILGPYTGSQSRAVISMTPEAYATVYSELRHL